MSIRTRTVAAPGRVARRVQEAEKVKSGAAQRAYARRRLRAEQQGEAPDLPARDRSVMAARIPFVVAIIVLLGCGLALTLLLTTRAAEDSYQLGDARATNRRLADERAALQREVETADSPPALAARASELGMIPAKDPARLLLAPDGTITVIGTPTPAAGAPVPPMNPAPTAQAVPPPGNVQARGERLLPVTTTPPSPTPVPNTVAAQASPVPPTVAPAPAETPVAQPPVAETPVVQPPAAEIPVPQPPAEAPIAEVPIVQPPAAEAPPVQEPVSDGAAQ